jgi:hypothetical protein
MDSGSGVGFSSGVTAFALVYKNSTNFQDAHRAYFYSGRKSRISREAMLI